MLKAELEPELSTSSVQERQAHLYRIVLGWLLPKMLTNELQIIKLGLGLHGASWRPRTFPSLDAQSVQSSCYQRDTLIMKKPGSKVNRDLRAITC